MNPLSELKQQSRPLSPQGSPSLPFSVVLKDLEPRLQRTPSRHGRRATYAFLQRQYGPLPYQRPTVVDNRKRMLASLKRPPSQIPAHGTEKKGLRQQQKQRIYDQPPPKFDVLRLDTKDTVSNNVHHAAYFLHAARNNKPQNMCKVNADLSEPATEAELNAAKALIKDEINWNIISLHPSIRAAYEFKFSDLIEAEHVRIACGQHKMIGGISLGRYKTDEILSKAYESHACLYWNSTAETSVPNKTKGTTRFPPDTFIQSYHCLPPGAPRRKQRYHNALVPQTLPKRPKVDDRTGEGALEVEEDDMHQSFAYPERLALGNCFTSSTVGRP